MKNILKRILVFSIVLLLSISNINAIELVSALKEVTVPQKNKIIEIYEVKEEKTKNTESIVQFYETDPNKQEILDYIAYKAEQERLEQERLAKLELRNNLVSFAKRFVGNPYVSGGTSLTNGADCSGFVMAVYRNFGIELPRTAPQQSYVGTGVSIENIQVGDIISYGYNGMVTHSALYIGDGKIVHASTPEGGIRIDNINIIPIETIRSVI